MAAVHEEQPLLSSTSDVDSEVEKPPATPTEPLTEERRAQVVAELHSEHVSNLFLLARQQQFLDLSELLEKCPGYWTETDEDGHSLLHWASLVGNKDFVALALSKGCAVDAKANNLQTPLMWAALKGHVPILRLLLDAKADAHLHDCLGATALMIAVQHWNHRSLLLLMHRGGEGLNDSDENGCTAVHWAAYKGDQTTLKLLDYFGADLQKLDNAGMLPLHRAVCAQEVGVLEWLVEKRSDPMLRNKEGRSCLDIAEKEEAVHIQVLFKKLMKKQSSSQRTKAEVEDVEQGGSPSLGEGSKKEGLFKSLTKDKAAQKLFPVFWLVCVSLTLFEYLTDLRQASYEVAPRSSLLFELGVPLSLALFFYVALTDPGVLPVRPRGKTGVEELMRALDGGVPEGSEPDLSRLCTTSWVLKDLRTKYCAQTGACIEEFDHYCVWLNTSIGKRNHRQFACLAVVEWLTQLVYIYLSWSMACRFVPYTGLGSWLVSVVTGYPSLTLIAVVQCLTCPWVFMLIIHQARLIVLNLTTNEMMNMHRYEHFWVQSTARPGHTMRMFQNPFDKGGKLANCVDFWWSRRRSQVMDQRPATSCQPKCCAHEHHQHA